MQSKLGDGVLITGTLPRDAEVKHTNKGTTVVEFSMKVGERGEGDHKEAIWANCVAFGKVAELSQNLLKGDIVLATGKIKVEEYTSKNGEKKKSTKVICDFVVAMGRVSPYSNTNEPLRDSPPPVDDFVAVSDEDDMPF